MKRIVFGRLVQLPSEVHDGMAEYYPLMTVEDSSSLPRFKVLYATGIKTAWPVSLQAAVYGLSLAPGLVLSS